METIFTVYQALFIALFILLVQIPVFFFSFLHFNFIIKISNHSNRGINIYDRGIRFFSRIKKGHIKFLFIMYLILTVSSLIFSQICFEIFILLLIISSWCISIITCSFSYIVATSNKK